MTAILRKEAPKVTIFRGSFTKSTEKLFLNNGFALITDPKAADLIVMLGGGDIDASMYGQKNAYCYDVDPQRDKAEKIIFNTFLKTPKVGICRGGQMLNVLSGGSMYQDLDNHGHPHAIYDAISSDYLEVSSMHHQLMKPLEDPHVEVFAVAYEATKIRSDGFYWNSADEKLKGNSKAAFFEEVEGVYYPDTLSLCYQPHPEMDKAEGRAYFFSLIERYFDIKGKDVDTKDVMKSESIERKPAKVVNKGKHLVMLETGDTVEVTTDDDEADATIHNYGGVG